ncbi:MAG: hypothetical protein Q9218_002815 [Villophora microphyllina]
MFSITFTDNLSRLPNEVLYMILPKLPDLPTLNNLIAIYPAFGDLVGARYSEIIPAIFRTSMPVEFQRIALALMLLRHGDHADSMCLNTHPAALAAYNKIHFEQDCLIDSELPVTVPTFCGLDFYLEDGELPWEHLKLQDPVRALEDIAVYHEDINHWVDAFVMSCCHKPTELGPADTQGDWPEKEPSQLERHRIHRAFWRFFLLCELACPRDTGTNGRRPLCAEDATALLIRYPIWEFEELECIYLFLSDSYSSLVNSPRRPTNAWEQRAVLRYQKIDLFPPIYQRLMKRMGYNLTQDTPEYLEEDDHDEIEDPFYGQTLASRIFPWIRPQLKNPDEKIIWADAPNGAESPNAGWEYYRSHSNSHVAGLAPWSSEPSGPLLWTELWPDARNPDRGSVICFQRWGYCIWDEKRLRDWGVLVPRSMRRWHNGDSGGLSCVHRKCQAKGKGE